MQFENLKRLSGHFHQIFYHDAMARYMRKSLFSVTATQKNEIFSRYLLCLIQETQQQKWLMDENIHFIWAGPRCCSRASHIFSLWGQSCADSAL